MGFNPWYHMVSARHARHDPQTERIERWNELEAFRDLASCSMKLVRVRKCVLWNLQGAQDHFLSTRQDLAPLVPALIAWLIVLARFCPLFSMPTSDHAGVGLMLLSWGGGLHGCKDWSVLF